MVNVCVDMNPPMGVRKDVKDKQDFPRDPKDHHFPPKPRNLAREKVRNINNVQCKRTCHKF